MDRGTHSRLGKSQLVADNLHHVLRHIVDLRDAGMEARYYVQYQDGYDLTHHRQAQYIMSALISVDDIPNARLSAIDTFLEHIKILEMHPEIKNMGVPKNNSERNLLADYKEMEKQRKCKYFHHRNVAFVMNCSKRFYLTHGECRLLDPNRTILYNIIDRNDGRQRTQLIDTSHVDDDCKRVLSKMKCAYKKLHGSLSDSVLLMYSLNIPCDIDYHECSKLVRDYVQETDEIVCIGYERIHYQTDKGNAMENLNHENIFLLPSKDLKREIRRPFVVFDQETDKEDVDRWDSIDELAELFS